MSTRLGAQPPCADEAGWCGLTWRVTGNEWLATSSPWLIGTPLKIVIVLVVAYTLRFLVRRVIDRMTRFPASGKTPTLLRPLKERTTAPSGLVTERRRQRAETIGSVLKSAATLVIFTIAIMEILSELGINLAPLIASAGIVGVALGFGAQNLVRDFLSGMFMMVEDQYGVGDYVDLGEADGRVQAVGLRVTTLRDLSGTVWYVRNGEVLRVGNMTQGFAVALVDIPVAHGVDIDRATELINAAAAEVVAERSAEVLEEAELLGVDNVTPECMMLRLTVKVKPGKQWLVQRALYQRISTALADAGFERPMPRIFGPQPPA